jgi:iron(III) transport system ATP-binding protein
MGLFENRKTANPTCPRTPAAKRLRQFPLHRKNHRVPSRPVQSAGDARVALLLTLFAVVAFSTSGCGGAGSAVPQLEVAAFNTWSMPPEGALIPGPRSITIGPGGDTYVLDNAGRVLVFDKAGKEIRRWHMPHYSVGKPEGICVLKDGRVAVADTHYHRVVLFKQDGTLLGMHGSHGEEPGQFIYPVAITQDDEGNYFVGEYGGNDRVQKFSPGGKFLLEFGSFGTSPGEFQRPSGVVWRDGKVLVADAFNNVIQVFSDAGEFIGILGATPEGSGLHYPYDLGVNAAGELFVVEYGGNRVSHLSAEGRLLGRFGSVGTGTNQFSTPWGIAVDSEGRVIVADTGNRRILELKL